MLSIFNKLFKNSEKNHTDNNKGNFEILKYDGLRASRIGKIDFAVKCFVEALKIENDFEVKTYLSQIYIQKEEYDLAKDLLEEMVQEEPTFIQSYIHLANVLFIMEDYDEMKKIAQKATEVNGECAEAFFYLAKAEKATRDELLAIGHLTKAITLEKNFIEALVLRAELFIELKQYSEAEEDIKAILSLNPEEESALLFQTKIEEVKGNTESAIKNYKKIIEINPFNESAYLFLGELYLEQKEVDKTIALLDEALEINKFFVKGYQLRGKAKLINGDKNGSVEDMKKALEINPKEEQNISGSFNNSNSTNVLGL